MVPEISRFARDEFKKNAGPCGPAKTTPQICGGYLFLEDFLLAFFAAFFFAAIKLTTFHAVRDLTVAPTWQKTPDCAGRLFSDFAPGAWRRRLRRPSTVTDFIVQFLAIIICLVVNMRCIKDIVKHLFMKIEIGTRRSTLFHAPR